MRSHPRASLRRLDRPTLLRRLDGLRHGRLELVLPDGARSVHGPADATQRSTVVVRSWRLFGRLALGGELGFAESFMAGEWDCDDLPGLFRLLIAEREALGAYSFPTARPRLWLESWLHRRRANTLRGSRRNVRAHYDLGNDVFRCFLDESMTYSCALYEGPGDSLEEAQERKLDRILDLAGLDAHHHLLELGAGWGSLALRAAQRVGCRVTCVTLSREQRRWCEQRVRQAGLEQRVRVVLGDYRELEGRFDRIVAVEMLEAVGEEHLPAFFSTCERLLGPGGRMVVQVITLAEPLYASYRQGCDFIQRYIFPGGHLPSLEGLIQALASSSRLEIGRDQDIGPHYVPTLRAWRDRLEKSRGELERLGFGEAWLRRWLYYFAYCEAGFASGTLQNHQLVLRAAGSARGAAARASRAAARQASPKTSPARA